jgi:hypothetical protein
MEMTLGLPLFAFTFAHRAFWAAAILALPAADILPRVPFCLAYVVPKAESAAAIALTSLVKRSCSFFRILTTPLRLVIKSPSRGIVTGGAGNECNGEFRQLSIRPIPSPCYCHPAMSSKDNTVLLWLTVSFL